MNRKVDFTFLRFCLLVGAVLELVFIALGVKPTAFVIFSLFAVVGVFLPGYQFIGWLKLDLKPFPHFALAWISGYPLTTFVYFICRYVQFEWLYGIFLLGMALSFIFLSRTEFTTPKLRLKEDGYFHSLLLGLFLLILAIGGYVNFLNGLLSENGSFQFASLFPLDFPYHVTLINELGNFFPPRIPAAPQYPLVYHYFPNLFAALLIRWLDLSVWDLISRFLPLFYFCSLVLSVILLTRELAAKKSTVFLALILVVLGSNWAFFAEMIGFTNPRATSTLEFIFVPTFTILHINPMVNAITLFFAGCFTLSRFQSSQKKAWLVASALLFTSIAGYKIFLAVMVAMGLMIIGLLLWWEKKEVPWAIGGALLPLVFVVLLLISLAPFKGSYLKFEPGFLNLVTLTNSGFFSSRAEGMRLIRQAVTAVDIVFLLKFILLGGIYWFLGSFAVRIIGLYHTRNNLFKLSANWVLSLLSWMCWLGIVLGTFFVVMPERINTHQFFTVSLLLAAVLTALYVESISAKKVQRFVAVLIIILAVPTTFSMLARLEIDNMQPPLTNAANYLKSSTPVEEIIAYPVNNLTYMFIIALSERRTMYHEGLYLKNLLGEKIPQALARDNWTLYRFRKGPRLPLSAERLEELKSIVRRNQVRYIVEDVNQKTRLPEKYLKTVYKNQVITIREVVGL